MLQTPATFTPLMAPRVDADALTFIFHGNQVLVRDADLALPDAAALAQLELGPHQLVPVGLLGERYVQAGWVERDTVPAGGYGWRGLRSLFGELDDDILGLAGRAAQLAEWARTHRFCGACSNPMALATGERCFKCSRCGNMAYPRISPAMMVLIRKGDAFLMASHTRAATTRYVPLAGFLEAGESIEEAVHREVFEEVGLTVTNLQYFASQSWPFPHSLMIAFTADYAGGEIRVDADEIAEARWFGPNDVWPEKVPHVSISSILVDTYRPPSA
ncbi:NAD(+) diphosphatase [Massilia sp. DWR3-1-1]|jgi:NAD+ diphosphatase|uniref:NAD(+) diphosphatase n=1 Tax=Massilia sp. DWR3-1-1 TaxID=2804559 RepID=UPI003CFB8DC7